MTSDTDLIEYLHDRVCEGSVILKVETDRTGDPARYRIGIQALGETEHVEYVAEDFRKALGDAISGNGTPVENRLELWGELDDPPTEEIESLIACLGDDASQLRDENGEDERATTMDEAAAMLTRLERANRQLFEMGQKMHAQLAALSGSPAAAAPAATHRLTKRIADLQEKAGMPLDQARELALSEIGITNEWIDAVARDHFSDESDEDWSAVSVNHPWLETICRPLVRAFLAAAPQPVGERSVMEQALELAREIAGMEPRQTGHNPPVIRCRVCKFGWSPEADEQHDDDCIYVRACAALASRMTAAPTADTAPTASSSATPAAQGNDTELLNWLEAKCKGASDSERYLPFRVYWGDGRGIRAAITAAMKGDAK